MEKVTEEEIQNALNVLYVDSMGDDEVQEFAETHPNQELRIKTKVIIECIDTECSIEKEYDGYLLQSE